MRVYCCWAFNNDLHHPIDHFFERRIPWRRIGNIGLHTRRGAEVAIAGPEGKTFLDGRINDKDCFRIVNVRYLYTREDSLFAHLQSLSALHCTAETTVMSSFGTDILQNLSDHHER